MHIFVAILTVIGFLVTAGGIVGALAGARRDLAKAETRMIEMRRLEDEEAAESARIPDEASLDDRQAVYRKYEQIYRDAELLRASWENAGIQTLYESRRLIAMLLESARGNLIWAGIGLLLSTIASVWSLFI